MKKIYILTAVFALLTLSLNAQDLKVDQFGNVVQPTAQTGKVNAPNRAATQVTVCDGTSTNYYVPFYGLYFDDNYQIDQMIYPESLLTNLVGKTITSVTFYANSNFSSNIGSGKFTFKIGTTNQTTFSSPITRITTGMTAVATNMTMSNCISGSQLIIDFSDNPFTYQGGNLVLDYELTTLASGYNSTAFYGQNNHTSASFYSRSTSNSTNTYGVYNGGTIANFLPKVTFGAEDSGPKIEVSPETLTINDSGTNNTFTVQGSNLGTDNVGVTVPDGSGFTRTTNDQYWGFVNNNGSVSGTATIGYEGRDLSASTTVSVGNNLTSATVAVTYVPDLYIYSDGGVTPWNFSANPAIAMTNQGNGIYTATLQDIPNNSHILFGRASGLTYNWENDDNRLFIGAVTDGGDWGYGDNTTGNLDTDPRDDSPVKYHPILIPEGDTYIVTINANDYTFTIEKLVLPPPENVQATADNDTQSATVTWDAPSSLPSKSVTEDFEDTSVFPPFTTGGVTATTHTGAFGEWTLYDATGGCVVYGSKQLNYEHESEPHAWFVFAPSGATADADYPNAVAHDCYSGAQYLESICPQSSTTAAGVSDHWLISPELSGNAQTISFYVSEMTTQYGDETYEIWVSTTDNDPSSFTQLGSTYNVSLDTWEEQLVELPAGTKYFAIRHTSPDIFGLLIDDVHYEGVIKPVSYNVYLNGVRQGSVDANDPLTYDFSNLAAGEYTVEISAVYPGNIESAKVPATFTIVGKTPTPTITYETTNATVVVTATGEGTVYLEVDGRVVSGEGSVSITIMRSLEDRTVTATATAVADNLLPSTEATSNVPVPALAGGPAQAKEGLLRMHLLIVDQMKEDIPDDNSHPDRYGYVLKWEQPANAADRKKSGTVDVEIKKTEAQVNGYYTKTQVDNDIDHDNSALTMNVLTADVGMYLPGEDPDVLYYEMQAKKDANPALGEDYVTQLQYIKNAQKYEEMLATSPNKTHQYPAEETYHYFDDSTPIVTGEYGVNFMTYAPSVSTWGIQRRYFEEDGLDNTYGAPIWKTSVGQVRMIHTEAQLQRGPQGSTQWDGVGGPCSLVFLGLEAFGDLPSTDITNIVYEPYKFRVWIQSPGNNLRGCNLIAADPNRPERPGEHWEGDGTSYGSVPVLVYEEETSDGHLFKDVQAPEDGNNVPWGSKIQFGALDAGLNDLIVYVRFYYRSTGEGISDEGSKYMLRGNRDGEGDETPEVPGYYATEDNDNPDVTTGILELWNDFNHGEVVSTTYVNSQGMQSDQPFDGVNIIVTRYSDGTTVTKKVVR